MVVFSVSAAASPRRLRQELGDKTDIRARGEFAGCALGVCPHSAHSSIAHGHVVTRAGDTYLSTCTTQHVAPPVCSSHPDIFAI